MIKVTKHQLKIIDLLSLGYTQGDIAKKLYVTKDTIKSQVATIKENFNAKNTPHLIRLYCEIYLNSKYI